MGIFTNDLYRIVAWGGIGVGNGEYRVGSKGVGSGSAVAPSNSDNVRRHSTLKIYLPGKSSLYIEGVVLNRRREQEWRSCVRGSCSLLGCATG